jgi:hypothetical protein
MVSPSLSTNFAKNPAAGDHGPMMAEGALACGETARRRGADPTGADLAHRPLSVYPTPALAQAAH